MKKNKSKNTYIVFEGVDNVGKSTQIEMMKHRLHDVRVLTRPCTIGKNGKLARSILNSEVTDVSLDDAFFMDAMDFECKLDSIGINDTRTYISDRSFLTALSHSPDSILCSLYLEMVTKPDLVVLLITTPSLIESRRKMFQDVREEATTEVIIDRQNNYLELLTLHDINFIAISASKTKEEIHSIIMSKLT